LAGFSSFLLSPKKLERVTTARTRLVDRRRPELSQGIKSVLKSIDRKGKALLMAGAPWEDGLMDFERSLEGLTQSEMQLVNNWISTWRTRIIKTNGLKSRS
jgi:hypothetical protein